MPGSESEDLVLLGDQHGKLHFLHQAALAEPGASLTSAAAGLLPHLTAQLHSTWVDRVRVRVRVRVRRDTVRFRVRVRITNPNPG